MSKEYVYVANATLDNGSDVVVDLEERGWADKSMLARTRYWSLVPKPGELTLDQKPWPMISIAIPLGAKPVFRSRVYRGIITRRSDDQIERKVMPRLVIGEFRSYCIGWKKGRTTVWTWVHPNGAVETTTEDDSRIGTMLRDHLNTIIVEEPEPEPEVEDDESRPAE